MSPDIASQAESVSRSVSPVSCTAPPQYSEIETPSEGRPFLQNTAPKSTEICSPPEISDPNERSNEKSRSSLTRLRESLSIRSHLEPFAKEQKKEVFSNKRSSACSKFALCHLPAVAVTIYLVVLYVKQQRWTPPHPSAEQLSALQFAAKAHESLILVSLTDILFHRIRYGLLESRGVPLGFLSSAFTLSAPIQYLLSWEFWGTALNPTNNRLSHSITTVSIVLLTLIGIGAGPFSAIVIIPRLTWWEVEPHIVPHQEHVFYISNKSYETFLDPNYGYRATKEYCKDNPKDDCEIENLEQLFSDMIPVFGNIPITPRTKNISFRSYGTVPQYRPITLSISDENYAFTTSPMGFVAEALSRDSAYSDSMPNSGIMIQSLPDAGSQSRLQEKWNQPVVAVRCGYSNDPVTSHTNMATFSFNGNGADESFNVTFDSKDELKYIKDRWNNETQLYQFEPILVDLQDEIPGSISAAFLFPESVSTTNSSRHIQKGAKGAPIQLCLVLSQWVSSAVWVTPQISSAAQIEFGVANQDMIEYLRRTSTSRNTINMTREWLTGTKRLHDSTFTENSNPAYGKVFDYCSGRVPDAAGACLPLTLALYLTDMLSNPTRSYEYGNDEYLDGPPGSGDIVIERIYYMHHYAYSPRDSTSIPVAFGVLLLHVWLVVIHATFTVLSPEAWHSSAWKSIGELVTLALRSRAPDRQLANVGGGVSSSETWTVVLSVREVVESERLELIVGAPVDTQLEDKEDGERYEEEYGEVENMKPLLRQAKAGVHYA